LSVVGTRTRFNPLMLSKFMDSREQAVRGTPGFGGG